MMIMAAPIIAAANAAIGIELMKKNQENKEMSEKEKERKRKKRKNEDYCSSRRKSFWPVQKLGKTAQSGEKIMVMIAPIIAAVSAQAVIAANKKREIERIEEEAAEKAKIDALEKEIMIELTKSWEKQH